MKFCLSVSLLISFIFFIKTSALNAQNNYPKIENGVSEALASYRQKILSNVQYQIHFDIPAERNEKIDALETISFNLLNTSTSLQLDFKESPDHLKSIHVNSEQIKIVFQNEHIIIGSQFLKHGTNSIKISFTAGESSLNRNNDFLYTLLVPDRARTLFPCFDQPDIKARFNLSLGLPLQWTALSNAPMQDSIINNNMKLVRYKESDVFSTYLFSFVAGNFQKTNKKINGRSYNFYHRETDSSKLRLSMDTVFGAHAAFTNYLEEYTGIKYPFQKLDFAALPGFQYGGMEHVGAIDYKAAAVFLDSGATKDQENTRSNLIAHETAHTWFGNLVTMQWFNDVWMKEVFANFMADKMTQQDGKSNEYKLKFLISHFPGAYAVDRTAGANPIRQPLTNLQEAGTLYGAIIYDKAPVMMRQLERLMGAEAFKNGIQEYLKKFSFGNADWPQLIKILDDSTAANLQAWNKVWVNTPGRPELMYSMQQRNGVINKLSISQKGERTLGYILPQFFELALVYSNHVDEITINMNAQQVAVKEAVGKKAPLFILFNSSGQGYGLFPIDHAANKQTLLTEILKLESPVMRASAYINLYENMLDGNYVKPSELLNAYIKVLGAEKEELNLNLLTGHVTDIYWRLILPSKRNTLAPTLEKVLWQLMNKEAAPNKKKILFKALQSISLSKSSLDSLYKIWKEQQPPSGVKLTEDDYTSLSLNLTLKEYPNMKILNEQLLRITNPDRKERLQFLMRALSPDLKVRDAFFASLKDATTRKKESYIADALTYLHHPLRANTSIRYVKESLQMLREIQLTGDIFFPGAWLGATLGSYQSSKASAIVYDFLKEHPAYNPKLKAKILQAADPLFRAQKLVEK